DLLRREPGAGLIPAAGIADQCRVIAQNENRLMTQLLKQPQFSQWHSMAQVHIDTSRIDAVLHPQWLAGLHAALEFLPQLVFRHDLLGPAADKSELFVDGFHLCEHLKAGSGLKSIGMVFNMRLAPIRRPGDRQDIEAGRMTKETM